MMKNLYIISEGRTECAFVKNVLANHLIEFDLIVVPITLPTGKNKVGVHKGGWHRSSGYEYAINAIRRVILTRFEVLCTLRILIYVKSNSCY